MTKKTYFPTGASAWTYLLAAVLLIVLGSYFQRKDFYSGMIITEYLLVFLPVMAVAFFFKVSHKKALKLNSLKISEVVLIPFIVILALPITMFMNLITLTIMAWAGKAFEMPIPIAKDPMDFVVLFFIISISAGICEEVFFRGMILSAYTHKYGKTIGVAVSSILFGFIHFNPQNLLGPIFLGVLFGVLVLITDSIFAGVIGHMANNGVVVIISYISNNGAKSAPGNDVGVALINQNPGILLAAMGVLLVIAIGSAGGVYGLIKVIQMGRKKDEELSLEIPEEVVVGSCFEDTEIKQVKRSWFEKLPSWVIHIPVGLVFMMYAFLSYLIFTVKQV